MGNAESTPQLPARTISRRERHPALVTSFDEKFDALKIDHGVSSHTERLLFSSDDTEHVDSAATEQYVRQLLKDPKNKLGLSALSTNNPSAVLEKPATVLRDTQYYNITIPNEGSPVSVPA